MGQSLNILNTKLKKRENKPINLRKSIKSNYIIKTIFSFLKKDIKLYLFHYNKQFQNLSGFNLEDYKKLSGICRTLKEDGYGEEYIVNTNKLIFKGKYLNGKKNGKGKEYYESGRIKFDGEYLNDKKLSGIGYNENYRKILIIEKNGKTRKYYDNGRLKFEGEYIKGVKQGKAKKYCDDGTLKFEGEYLNGKKYGKGKEYYNNGNLMFEGKYFIGNAKQKHKKIKKNKKKRGFFGDDFFEKYMNRKGKFYDVSDGKLLFEGEFHMDENQLYGKMVSFNKDGKIIAEEVLKNEKGKVKKYYDNGNLKMEIEYFDKDRNGKGKEYYENGKLKYEGEYKNESRNGKGKEYDENGNLQYEGEYSNGYRVIWK